MNLSSIDDEYVVDIIKPIYLYAAYEGKDDDEELSLYTKMKEYYVYFVDKYVSNVGRKGYFPMNVLVYSFLPVVYKLFPNEFESILSELHMDRIDFNDIEYVVKSIICDPKQAFLKQEFVQKQYELYTKMMSEGVPKKIQKKHFVSAILEIFPNKDKTGGHAITLLKGIDDHFYVIDDQNAISRLEEYYTLRESRLYSISIKDIDEVTIANLNAILHAKCIIDDSCAFSKRVSRYELNFEHKFLTVNESKLLKEIEKPSMMWWPLVVGLMIGLVVGLVVGIVTGRQWKSSTTVIDAHH